MVKRFKCDGVIGSEGKIESKLELPSGVKRCDTEGSFAQRGKRMQELGCHGRKCCKSELVICSEGKK